MMVSLKEAFRFEVKLSPALDVGEVPTGFRRVIPIVGGTVSGERLNGEILPVGADWNLARRDGTVYLSAHYIFRTDDGALISILNEGWANTDNAAMQKIMDGEQPDAAGWYAKTHPRFEAADPKYAWLNSTVFLCEMLPPPDALTVLLIFYEVL